MARSEIVVQYPTSAGYAPTYSAADVNGSLFSNDGRTILIVKNASGAPVTVTLITPGTVDGLAIPDRTFSVPATTGERWWVGSPAAYDQPDGTTDAGKTYIDYSAVTSVTVAVLHA